MSANINQNKKYNNHYNTVSAAKTALYVALLCISAYIIFPLPFTPIVLSIQTVMVNIIGLTLEPKLATKTLSIYLIMGLIGLPVFSGGTSGPGKLFGPTGGFYFGFLIAVILISLLKGKKISFLRYTLITVLIGLPLQHICAIFVMAIHNGFNIPAAAVAVSLPFIPGDILKCLLASYIATVVNKRIR